MNAADVATLRVGSGASLRVPSAAARVARDGDVVEIECGVYDDVAVWTQNDLTIRCIAGRGHFRTSGRLAEDKGIWLVKGRNTIIERAEFSGARGPHRNGSGIRGEGIGLTLRDCAFHHNEDGVLAGGGPESDIVVERCEFSGNGYGDGQSHNIYIASARSFTLRACYSHHARVGHNVKSRAATNYILYNRIMDEQTGRASYAIDLCNGGRSYVIGNLVQKGTLAENETLLAYGADGLEHSPHGLYVVNNTMVNDRGRGGWLRALGGTTFVRVWGGPSRVRLVNNLFVGQGRVLRGAGEVSHNVHSDAPGLIDRAGFDYRLAPGSPAAGGGTDPGDADGVPLTPVAEYVHRASERPRAPAVPLDVGAHGRLGH